MTNRERLNKMGIDNLLSYIQPRAEKFDVCIMSLLPGGGLMCPWHNDCRRCLEDWLNEEISKNEKED